MRAWYNDITLDYQSKDKGLIPFARSNLKEKT